MASGGLKTTTGEMWLLVHMIKDYHRIDVASGAYD